APEMDLDQVILASETVDTGGRSLGGKVDEVQTRAALAVLARLEERPNATMKAIADGVPAVDGWTPTQTLPFSSARKCSAGVYPDGAWCLGGSDVVLRPDDPLRTRAEAL